MATATRGLGKVRQDDFSAGAFQGVARHLIPATGLYGAQNSLFDEDAAVYKRGGSEWLAPQAVGTSMRWIWDGVLAVGPRTLAANTDDFLSLSVNDTAFVNIGGAGLAAPVRSTVFDGVLILDDKTMFGGSRLTTGYGGSTLGTTHGSKAVVGTGTAFLANVDPGMLLRVGTDARYYIVASVDDDTHITLTSEYRGLTTSSSFAFNLRGDMSNLLAGIGVSPSGFATIFNRLLVMDGTKLRFSGGIINFDWGSGISWSFDPDDFHEFNATLLGVAPVRDLVFVFTTDGVFVVTGMAYDLLDPDGVNFQQQVEPVNSDLILWGKEGLATYQNQMLAPAVDGLWTMGAAASPVQLSKSIQQRWRDHVHSGHKPGLAAVFRNHYFLPVLNSSNAVVDHLVCRLDRPQDSHIGTVFPWSWWTGQAANTSALATRISGAASRSPKLLAADHATGRVLDLTSTFEPSDTNATEADNSSIEWRVELRDYATGAGNLNHVRRLRIRYELITASGGPPAAITAQIGTGEIVDAQASYGSALYGTAVYADPVAAVFTLLQGSAPPDGGTHPHTWHFAKHARFVRALLVASIPSSRLILRSVEWYIRPSGDDR